jgi:hypothetical protein
VREGLVNYLQRDYPQHLPTLRTRRLGDIAAAEQKPPRPGA